MKTYDNCDVFQTFHVTDTSLLCEGLGILVIALRQLRPNHVAISRGSCTEHDCCILQTLISKHVIRCYSNVKLD